MTFRSVLDEHAPADVRVVEVQPGVGADPRSSTMRRCAA